MVLTKRQRGDLHAGIYEYLLAQEGPHFEEAAAALAEADPTCVRTPLTRGTSTTSSSNGSVSLSHLLSNGNANAPPLDEDERSVSSRLSISSRFSTLSMRSTSTSASSANLPVLERKWTAVPRLQKKVLELERTLAANAKLFAHRGTGGGMVAGANVERRKLPRPPCSHTLQGHSGVVTCVAIHPTFTLAVSGSEDGAIKVWDHESGEYTRTLKGHTNTVHSLVFTPTGSHVASCSSDLSIKLWDFGTYSCIRTLRGHDHTISMLRFVPLSRATMTELTAQQSGTNASGGESNTTTGVDAASAGALYLTSVSRDATVKMWDMETGFCAQTLGHHSDWVRCLAIRDSDGERMATAGNDQTICVFALSSSEMQEGVGPKEIARLEGHNHVIESLSFVTSKCPAAMMDDSNGATAASTSKESGKDDNTSTTDYLASGGRDRTVRLWNISTSACLSVFKYHENWVRSVVIHPSGKYILSAGDDRTIRVMDISSQRCLRTIQEAHPHFVTCIAMHPTLPTMISGGVDQTVKCWQLD